MLRLARIAAIQVAAVLAGACTEPTKYCNLLSFNALDVSIVDAKTGRAAASNATITWTIGAFHDSLTVANTVVADRSVSEIDGVAGTYDVVIRKPGYADWKKTGILVSSAPSGCGVTPVALTAALDSAAVTLP